MYLRSVVLQLSPAQMAAMRAIWVSPLVEQLLRHIRPAVPEHVLPTDRGRRLLTAAVHTARRHRLSSRPALLGYAILVVRIGEDLGHGPPAAWAGPVLDDPWLSAAEKLEQLEQLAQEQGLLAPHA